MNSQQPVNPYLDPSFRLVGILLLIVIIWVPTGVLTEMLQDLQERQVQMIQMEKVVAAEEILAQMERLLDVDFLVARGCDHFSYLLSQVLRNEEISKTRIDGWEKAFFRRFPRRSTLIWFNRENRILRFTGRADHKRYSRGWTSLIRYLTNPQPSEGDEKSAGRIAKMLISKVIEPISFREGLLRPFMVYFDGELHAFRLVHFPGGGVLLLIPQEGANPGWEQKRTVKLIGGIPRPFPMKLGVFCEQADTLVDQGDLNYNLLVGLKDALREGRGSFAGTDGFLYSGRFFPKDASLFLVVGLGERQDSRHIQRNLVRIAQPVLWGIALVLSGLTLLILSGRIPLELTLQTRFHAIVTVLVVIPVSALMILAVSHSMRIAIERREETVWTMESILGNAELAAMEEIGNLESRFRRLLQDPQLLVDKANETLLTFYQRQEKNLKFSHLYFFRRDTQPLVLGMKTFDPITETVIEKLGYPQSSTRSGGEGKKSALSNLMSGFSSDEFIGTMGRMICFEAGTEKRFVFHERVFRKNEKEDSGYFSVAIRFANMQTHLLEIARRKIMSGLGPMKARMQFRSKEEIRKQAFKTGKSSIQENLFQLVQLTGRMVQTSVRHKNREFQVRARLLPELDAVGLVALPVPEHDQLIFLTWGTAGLTVILALVMAWWASFLLREFLLQPLLFLKEAMIRVNRGDYSGGKKGKAGDELGLLLDHFQLITDGLGEKERMARFVRADLLAGESQRVETSRREIDIILFAGIRDFSRLEPLLSPRAAMAIMSHFLGVCEEQVKKHGGEVDKFIGDSALAVFPGKSSLLEDGAWNAVRAALEVTRIMHAWNDERRKLDLPQVLHGIGLAVGPVVAGHVGSRKKRLDFTVIGDTVNLAARIEKMAGRNGSGSILLSESMADCLREKWPPDLDLIETGITRIRGKNAETRVFELRER
jgi:class 3 adenylate cyclase